MRRALWLALLLLTAACPKPAGDSAKDLLSQLKAGLAERDAKVSSYRLEGVTREQGLEASFQFAYRAPNKLRGVLVRPERRTFAFDGARLYDLQPDGKRFTAYELKLPEAKAAQFLNQTFSVFVSEGFRVPLLLSRGVTVTRAAHPKAREAVEVKVQTQDDSGQALTVTYSLRWPACDFLGKKLELAGKTSETRVDEEHCEPKLGLCFPRQLTLWEGKAPVNTTLLTKVEINPQIPAGEFTLSAPEGFEAQSHELVEKAP